MRVLSFRRLFKIYRKVFMGLMRVCRDFGTFRDIGFRV